MDHTSLGSAVGIIVGTNTGTKTNVDFYSTRFLVEEADDYVVNATFEAGEYARELGLGLGQWERHVVWQVEDERMYVRLVWRTCS